MSFEQQVKNAILTYPRIFPDALRVYEHIFLEIGNGYEWKDGKLVYPICDEICTNKEQAVKRVLLQLCEELKALDSLGSETSFTKCLRERKISNAASFINTIYNVDELVDDLSIIDYGEDEMVFRISEYSAIANIPDNIENDYLSAINVFIRIMIDNRDRVRDSDNLLDSIISRVEHIAKSN